MGSYSSAFKTEPHSYPKGGQCFECGLWFSKGRGYACCKEHKKGTGRLEQDSGMVSTFRSSK